MAVGARVRDLSLHAAAAGAGAVAAVSIAASHSVDLYALYGQLNEVIASITKLIGMATPLVTAIVLAYKTTTKQKLADVAADPKAPEIAASMPVTPESAAVAKAMVTPP